MRELFVYYRVRADKAAEVLAAVQRLQQELCERHPGLSARRLCRPASGDGVQTCMETYAVSAKADAQGVGPALERDIETCARPLLPFLEGPRHVEAFIVV
jgi:hypothetical protein